jgi:hypothetical protein
MGWKGDAKILYERVEGSESLLLPEHALAGAATR